ARGSKFSAAIRGAQPFVEPPGLLVLRYDPQVEAAVGIVRAAPACDLGYESCSHTLPMLLATDVNVVEQRAPLLIVTTVRASKAHEDALIFGEDDELIRSGHGQALVPNV